MVVKCAKCIEFIFLCSTTTSSSRYAILPLDQDTLMWISMIFMQMTPAYNDCTVDTLHKSVSVRQLSAEPKPLLPSKEPGICHRFNCCCCWERGGEVPASFRYPQKLDWSGLWLKVGLICKIGRQSEAVAERNPWNLGNPYPPLSHQINSDHIFSTKPWKMHKSGRILPIYPIYICAKLWCGATWLQAGLHRKCLSSPGNYCTLCLLIGRLLAKPTNQKPTHFSPLPQKWKWALEGGWAEKELTISGKCIISTKVVN